MKLVILFVVFVSVFVVTTAKPFIEEADNDFMVKQEEESDAGEELENSGDEKEDEEDGSSIDEEPRGREKRDALEKDENFEKTKDSSGDQSEEEKDDSREKSNKDSSGDDDEGELQWKNTLGIRGPLSISAIQPPYPEVSPSTGKKQKQKVSLDFVTPPGNIEITPFSPSINRLKKVRRRCLCPLPCDYEVIGCSGPYTLPCGGCGGFWPGLGCGGCGGYGGLYGLGGFGLGVPMLGAGVGYGGCGGCGGCGGGCGGCGGGCCGGCGGCGGGCCGFPMMCCCKYIQTTRNG